MSTPKIVDLSRYQDGFDFFSFQQGGGIAVICKASEGSSDADNCYQGFRRDAKNAGLAFASYHFLRPGDMQAQAAWYLSCANPDDGERVVADYEDGSVSLTDLVDFLKAIQSLNPSLQLTVYGSNVLEETIGSQTVPWLADNTSLWTAAYSGSSSPGAYCSQVWPVWSLWQYTDCANVPGFAGPVDGDNFNGDDAACLKWFGPSAGPAPAPQPEIPTVEITTTGAVTLIVNGQKIGA
jgi:GH25 family lysozyme M1 (1,4-beta-N-acetylmuramidase)